MCFKKLGILLPAVLIMLSAYAYGDNNVLANPGFERGTSGWFDRTCAIEPVSSPVRTGTGAVRVVNRLMNWQGVKQSIFGKVIEGKVYKISGWVRLENAKCDTVALSVEQQDDGGTQYIGVGRAVVTDTAWAYVSGDFTLKITGNLAVLDAYFEGPAPGVIFYVDDANVFGPEVDAPVVIPANPKGKGIVDLGTRHQVMEGFGASGAWYTKDFINHNKKDELYNLLFKELGLDIFRIGNYYDVDSLAFNESMEIARVGKSALNGKLRIMISSWCPPPYLKSNNQIIGGTLKKKNGKFVYDEYAQWWCSSIAACSQADVKVDYINLQNEPDYEAPWNSCIFSASEEVDTNIAAYDKAFEAVRLKLKAEMGDKMPKMLAPEASSLGNTKRYIQYLEKTSDYYGYATHLYDCSGCGSAPDRFIPSMNSFRNFIKQRPVKPVFQTEFEDEPGTWADAINTALVMHNSLTIIDASGYLYWDLFWAPGTALISMNDSASYTIKPTYYTFKNYSAFIDPDWQRVEASTDNTGLRISAYISPDNSKLTAVIINTTDSTNVSLRLSFKDFKIGKGGIYRSSEKENCALVGNYNGKAPLKLPANSVTTLSLTSKKK
ncbi:MAG: carbohydrate binding domain-containing protein [Bacteroidetes bacterium]|nr:carbohydrate binding domain-containing protein [Bacteroidota bacterium]